METKANYAAVGLFVVVMIMTALGFLYWLTNAGERARQMDIRIVFSEPVTGLYQGSSVLFNGIKVGEVSSLSLDSEEPSTVIAIARVDRTLPLKVDTKAKLSFQGVTGVANLQLEGGSRGSPLLASSVAKGAIPTIPAEVSPFQDIMESARRVLNRADNAMGAIESFININEPAFSRSVNNIDTFTEALARNSGGIGDLVNNVSAASKAIGNVSGSLEGSARRLEEILHAVDPAKVTVALDQVSQAIVRVNEAADHANKVVGVVDTDKVKAMMADLANASSTLNRTMTDMKTALAAVDPATVADVTGNVKSSARDLADFSKGLKDKAGDVQAILEQAKALVTTLRSVAEKTDYFVAKANGLIGDSNDGKPGIMAEASDAMRSVRAAADTLNEKMGPIANGVDRFTDRGLTNIDQLASDARRTLDLLNRLIAAIQSNPQQFIFGGDKTPEYPARR